MYPLRPVNEPAIFVMGEKAGQKVYQPGANVSRPNPGPMAPPGVPINFAQQHAIVAQQNSAMEALERRRERERARERSGSTTAVRFSTTLESSFTQA